MTQTLEQTMQPVNNIYHVPILKLYALKCFDGETAVGHSETTTLAQGKTPQEAKDYLKGCWEFAENYVTHSEEKRKDGKPFKLDETKKPKKVLYCERRFQNSRGDYTCGKPMDGETQEYNPDALNGEFGGCVIQGYSIPDFFEPKCPYQIQRDIKLGKLEAEIEYII